TIMKRLPSIREIAIKFANVDPIKDPIPVVPTIHYQMGGIPTNYHGQVVVPKGGNPNTVVAGLYAIGECACVSVHGANRLGTNSLLDLLVFGRAAGNHIVSSKLNAEEFRDLPADSGDASLARLARLEGSSSGENIQDVANDLRKTMQAHCGVFRTEDLLSEGVSKIAEIDERARSIHLKRNTCSCCHPHAITGVDEGIG
ncbi:MAG: FAD-binding protein, partial [Betaproteobacteria bacterium]|nr:FAD-binding protein [Betaproteobacteria bacterium]